MQSQPEHTAPSLRPGLRAILLGVVLIPLNALWIHSMELVWDSGQPTMQSLFFNAVFVLLVLSGANLALRRWLPAWALDPRELVVVYAMVSLASAVVGHDFLQVLVLMLPTAVYFATPENRWEDLFAEHLSSPILMNDARAARAFWEGDASLYSWEHFAPWVTPLVVWGGFVLVLLGVMTCLNLMVWRRWTDQEKLSYPLTQIPFQLTRPGFQLLASDLMGSGFFWIGLALAGGIDVLNGFAYLYPSLPSIKVTARDLSPMLRAYPWRAMGNTWVSVYPFAIGLGYLMPQDFLFSCWFFHWFWKAEMVVAYLLGHHQAAFPYVKEQTVGAYLGIAVAALWVGRHHFAALLGSALGTGTMPGERRPALPPGVVLGGLATGLAVLVGFMANQLKVSVPAAVVYLVSYLLISLAITRMRAEFGLPVHDLFTGPLDCMVNIGGTHLLGRRNILGLGLLWWLERVQRSHPMPHSLEGLALGERRAMAGREMLVPLCIAMVVGVVAGCWSMLHLGYRHGFGTLTTDSPYLGNGAFTRPASWLNAPRPFDAGRLGAVFVGTGFTLGLLALRQRYLWWPFHPVGYAASSIWFISLLWVPLLVAWAVKGLVIRYGGHKLYKCLLPLFIGLVIGEFFVGGLWGLVGAVGKFATYRFWAY